ncbi:MAG: HlyC/CorC family transporter [Ruminococcaceae bacterium]|nr:HlyC/CorC family transporter [Oscillospiraceae bacterium]
MESDARKPSKVTKALLYPFILLNKGLDKMLSKALGEGYYGKDNVTQDNIMSMVDAGNEYGSLEDESAQMINNVFEFGDMVASDVMTHRTNVVGVEIDSPLEDIVYIALEKGFSRIPIYKENIDAIIGIVIVKDLLCLVGNKNKDNLKIKDFLRDVVYIPESCSCSDAFKFLTNLKTGMGVVVDEYGGTAGIITLEDIIESIMGDIEDEYDEEVELIIPRNGGAYEVNGEADPEEVLELFGYELEENHEYDTIAGFVTDLLGYIPEEEGEHPKVRYKDIMFKVKSVENNCIEQIIVRPCKEEELAEKE